MEQITLKEFSYKLTNGSYHSNKLFFQQRHSTIEPELIYPEALQSKELQNIISDYIYYNYGNLYVNLQVFDNFATTISDFSVDNLIEIDCYKYIWNVLKMNEFNIKTKAQLLTAEYNPTANYEKWSEIKNHYDEVHKTNDYDADINTLINGATTVTSTDSTSAYDASGWTDADKNITGSSQSTDTNTRNARTDVETVADREDKVEEHTYGNIGVMTISDILAGVWSLGDMEFVKYVADLIVNALCLCVFDVEV